MSWGQEESELLLWMARAWSHWGASASWCRMCVTRARRLDGSPGLSYPSGPPLGEIQGLEVGICESVQGLYPEVE